MNVLLIGGTMRRQTTYHIARALAENLTEGNHIEELFLHLCKIGKFSSNARLFMAPVSFEVKYELFLSKGRKPFQIIRLVPSPIPIGALSLCWDMYRNSSVCPWRGRSVRPLQ